MRNLQSLRLFKGLTALTVVGLLGSSIAGCGSDSASDGTINIQFFQNKVEAVKITNKLIKEFESDNPNIKVEQQNSSDTVTVLKSRIAKNDIPDVIAANATYYNDLAQAGIFTEQNGTEAYKAVADKSNWPYLRGIGQVDKDYVVPQSVNAQVVLYNVDLFNKLGLTKPTTWNEFVETAQKVKDAGEQPFIFTWKDAWTAKTIAVSLGSPEQGKDFWKNLQSGKATFAGSKAWKTAAERMLKLKTFAQPDPAGTSYDDGNSAFATGGSVMYIQGIWAIPAIRAANPDIKLGSFVLPTSDKPNSTPLLAAPDSLLGVSASSQHKEAAQKFVDFMLSKNAQEEFVADQNLLSVRSDVPASEDYQKEIKQYIDEGNTCMYADSMFTGASDMQGLAQIFFQNEDIDAFLTGLDNDFQSAGIK